MVHGQRGARRALAGFCLAALTATAGAPLFAAEPQKPSSVDVVPIEQSVGVGFQADESDWVSHGGALYSPFSTAFDMAASTPHAYATSTRQNADDGPPHPVTAAVTALVAVGFLVVLVRVLIAS
ncbi:MULTISPECIES: hypothetical protein [unclassified Variovorax]|uniref:hypothetical protein n=1 Tax=unclassified Variovorax TaxID=663243 RepID=UPI003ECFC83A